MLILRQKEYSSITARARYLAKRVGNKASVLPAKLTRGFYERTGNLGQRAIADSRVKAGTKSKSLLKREAIQEDRKMKTSVLEALNASTSKEGVRDYVGKSAGKFVETATENPLTTAGIAVGYGSTPIQVATGTYWGPIGSASTATEQFLKRRFPKYKHATERLTEVSNKRHWKDKASGAVKSILVPVM